MKKLLIITMLGVLSSSLLTAEGGVEFSGKVETLWGAAAPWTKSDTSAGRFTLGKTSFTGEIEAFYGNSSVYADADLSYDAVLSNSGNLGNGFDLSAGEMWLDYTEAFWGIRIGRQKAAWGKADGIDITNILCPSDMSSLAAMTGDDSKLAIDALRFSVNGNMFSLDAYWIPFFTPSTLPLDQGNTLRKYIVPSTVEFPIPALNQTLTLPVSIGNLEKPELAIWNGEYALRFSTYFSALDFSFYGFYGWDDIPVLNYSVIMNGTTPVGMNVSGKYERMSMIGADAALPLGETVLRLEAAFFPQRHMQKSQGSSLQRNELSALAGIDWMPSGWTITAQYYCDYVFGDLDGLKRSTAYTHGASLSISKSFINDTLELSFAGIIGLNDYDSMISPSVTYSLSDQISLGLKAFIFLAGPEKDGQYGAYKDLSSICLNASFSF